MRPHRPLLLTALLAGLVALPDPASAHAERESFFPEPPGRVPRYRTGGPTLLVCKDDATLARIRRLGGAAERSNLALFEQCREDGYRNIQAAVDAVSEEGSRILILPGVYREGPTAGPPTGDCADLGEEGILSYEDHLRCPHNQNLIAIMGDSDDPDRECDLPVCRLQIEGTGDGPEDVVVDNGFAKLNGIRADRADGIYFRNFTVQNAEFNSVYVIETDGFVIDRMVGRWNDEYGFLTFASDHGLYKHCEAYGNGDGGVYPGSAADLHGERPAVEIKRCNAHHNLIGLSGTAGNSLLVHHNRFHHNTLGATVDSLFPGHPGLPQDHATFRKNWIYSNNQDYNKYWEDGTCQNREQARKLYPEGVVCPTLPAPVGTGFLLLGGNSNTIERNWMWNNWRAGAFQLWTPAALREENDPAKQYDTSHFNRYLGNRVGMSPAGDVRPNGVDFWWDGEGEGNCWEANEAAPGGEVTSDPPMLPTCDFPSIMSPVSRTPMFASCATWTEENHNPPGCDWTERPPRPE
ncbi:MAG TPA: right-handed parallel beta-helix repeat-containing protein [Actinomycetota bacterium]|nr:right-handed parallel beta-helix repeat-containing protein [Actinomycetota bacterium]